VNEKPLRPKLKKLCSRWQNEVKATKEHFGANLEIFFRRICHFPERREFDPLLNLGTAHSCALMCHREHHASADHDQFAKRVSITHTAARRDCVMLEPCWFMRMDEMVGTI
jgi:hypothetical protein